MLEPGSLFDVLETVLEQLFRRSLQVAVDRRVDAETALVDTLPAKTLDELAPNLFLEIEAEGLLDFEGVVDLDRRGLRLFEGCRINRAEFTIVCSTILRRAIARSGLTVGAKLDGDWMRPASSAASATLSSDDGLPK